MGKRIGQQKSGELGKNGSRWSGWLRSAPDHEEGSAAMEAIGRLVEGGRRRSVGGDGLEVDPMAALGTYFLTD
jgi:hypothetical protein